jgi:hypothetical protein
MLSNGRNFEADRLDEFLDARTEETNGNLVVDSTETII